MRQFNISSKTALKRLNDAVRGKESKSFEIHDTGHGRRLRVYQRGVKSPKVVSDGAPLAYNAMALGVLENSLKSPNWQERLRGYVQSKQIVQAGLLQLEEDVAKSNGRVKYTKERSKLQKTWIRIRLAIINDPDYDKMQPLLDRRIVPPPAAPGRDPEKSESKNPRN